MNVFTRITFQSLKKNKTRTIVTIIGILLSSAMICAVTTFASSFLNYAKEIALYSYGNWHGQEMGASLDTFEKLYEDDRTTGTTWVQEIGYAYANGSENEYKPYIYLLGSQNDQVSDYLPIHITSGRYPTDSTEILLPEHLFSNGGIKYEIGDTLTLELGLRMLDGYPMNQQNPCYINENGETILNGESLDIQKTCSYTVVGFYERFPRQIEPFTAPGYTALTISEEPLAEDSLYDIYFRMENPKELYAFMEEMELTGESNTDLLLYSGVFPFNSLSTMLYSLAAIVIFLIMFGSISLIYNAFAISVSERTKQFGLLSSIGATKKQLKHMVLSEALMVSMVGIPLGILSGIGGIGITLFFLGSKFRTFGYPIDMKLCVSIPAILIAVVVALITVLLSAWVPSRRARKVSAVEAIRQTMDIQNTKPVKTSRLTYKIFGLSGMLASKYYKRSRKKYRATVLSLFMSIVLFVSASAFTGYLMESISGSFGSMNFDLCISISGEQFTSTTPEALLNQMGKAKSVTKAAFSQDYFTRLEVPASLMTEEGINFLKKNSADNTSGSSLHMYAYITFADDETYREVLKENNLKEADYMNPDQPLALVVDSITCFNSTKEKYETIRFFSQDSGEFTFSLENYEDSSLSSTLTTGKILETTPYFISSSYDPWLIYPLSLKEQVLAGLDAYAAVSNFILSSENPGESYSDLQTVLTDAGFNGRNLQNIAEREESERNLVSIIQVFSYGFIILISLIAAANVFNTISTNISLRRREFAMLKSVGMTRKGFQQMMNFECFLYGFKALLPGLPVSCCITYLIYLSIMEGYETTFRLPWKAILIAVASVFLVVFVTMMYSMNKINKENPIDALKNENL